MLAATEMGMNRRHLKNEYAGAKNGGGHCGYRIEAKQGSKRVRRWRDKQAIVVGAVMLLVIAAP
jgi:hypothetical protein